MNDIYKFSTDKIPLFSKYRHEFFLKIILKFQKNINILIQKKSVIGIMERNRFFTITVESI